MKLKQDIVSIGNKSLFIIKRYKFFSAAVDILISTVIACFFYMFALMTAVNHMDSTQRVLLNTRLDQYFFVNCFLAMIFLGYFYYSGKRIHILLKALLLSIPLFLFYSFRATVFV
jgi:hypothetical protein